MKARRLAIPRLLHVPGRGTWFVRVKHLRNQENRGVSYGPPARNILVENDLPPARQDETFVHEVLHAAWPQRIVPVEVEERLVTALAPRLHGLIATRQLVTEDAAARLARLESYRRYNAGPKGKARAARREQTVRGKERIRRYAASPKGQAKRARYEGSMPRALARARYARSLGRALSVARYSRSVKKALTGQRYRLARRRR